MKFSIIAAADQHWGLGKNNRLPWKLPGELRYFNKTTSRVEESGKINAVIMGRKTWESLPSTSKPLRDRINVVLSRDISSIQLPEGVLSATSLDEAFTKLTSIPNLEKVFVIGGANLYAQAINHPDCRTIYLTRIEKVFDCDTFFPNIDPERYKLISESIFVEENGVQYRFQIYHGK